jgi:hypothetical protein
VEILDGERYPQSVIELYRLLKQDLLRKHDFAIRASKVWVRTDHRGMSRVMGECRKQFRFQIIDCDPKPVEMSRITQVEAGRAFMTAIGRDIADEIKLATLQDDVVFKHWVSLTICVTAVSECIQTC